MDTLACLGLAHFNNGDHELAVRYGILKGKQFMPDILEFLCHPSSYIIEIKILLKLVIESIQMQMLNVGQICIVGGSYMEDSLRRIDCLPVASASTLARLFLYLLAPVL